MEKSINALLNNNLRVIIPDFGAFIIRQKEPRVVVFNEFLRYNDGLLIGFIAKSVGVDLDTAQQMVSDFTSNMVKALESGRSFNLEGIGILQKDNTGKILFESEQKSATPDIVKEIELGPPIVLTDEEVSIRLGSKPKQKPKAVPKPKSGSKPKSTVKPPVRRKKETTRVVAPKPETIQTAAAERITKPVLNEKEEQPVPPVTHVQEERNALQEEKHHTVARPAENEFKIRKFAADQVNLILKWIILILSANALIIAWFLFKDDIRDLFKKKKAPVAFMDSVYQNLSDSVRAAAVDTTLIYKESAESDFVKSDSSASENLRYYIVAGCFRDEINADELVKSLKDQGFKAEKFGKIGNLYAVSFASFDDKEMAVRELKRIREEIHPEAWMTRF
jgi:nucleoid DNA-binding protein